MNEQFGDKLKISDTTVAPAYATDFVCTYEKIKEYEDSIILYQLQFLQAFNVPEFNEEKINSISEELYEKFKNNTYIINILNATKSTNYCNYSSNIHEEGYDDDDDLTTFRKCFQYDLFYLFHSILCSLINNKEINETYYKNLLGKFNI